MQKIAKPVALLALVATILPPVLFVANALSEGPMRIAMLIGAVLWFAFAPFWLKSDS